MTHGMDQAAARRAHGGLRLPLVFMLLSLVLLGEARAAGAGYWHTSGNQILDANNQPVRIAAVNWYGFETQTFVAHGLWIADYKAILNLIKNSGYNTVRIPLSDQMVQQNPVLGTMNINRNGINTDIAANATALDVLDKIIAHCGTIGLRVILDNHRSNAGDSAQEEGLWYTSAFPESTWLANWRALTTRYLGNTTVIGMDLRNEPHGPVCWGGDPAGCSAANDWPAAATRAGNAVLAINPNLLIIVEGNDRYNNSFTWWGGMLRGVASRPVVLNVANRVVYSAHDYGPHLANQPWFNGSTTPASLAAIWNQNWGFVHNQGIAPVWIGEFGTTNTAAEIQSSTQGSQGQWFSSMVQYIASKPAMSWAYWAMNGNDSYALFNMNFNAIVSAQKQQLLATIQFPLDTVGTTPGIASVSPTSGAVGTSVTISGSNFGNTQGGSTLRFGSTNASVSAWSATSITAVVPNVMAGAQSVTVVVNGVSSNASTFTVVTQQQTPAISALNPTSGAVGSSVTVSGSNFGASQGTSTVRFGTANASISSWSATQIVAMVPNIAPGATNVSVTVNGVVSNAPAYTVTTVTQPDFSIARAPTSLTVNRGAGGTVAITLTRTGGFTGNVTFAATGLPSGVSATFAPAQTTGNTSTLTLAATSAATLGNATVIITASSATTPPHSATVALTVANPTTGTVTASGVVASNSPWFAEEQLRLNNTVPITALAVTITVARNPSSLTAGGQYNTIGGTINQSTSTTASQVTFTFTLAAGQQIAPGTGRTFAAQLNPGGTAHPTSGDSWSVTYTSGGTMATSSGAF
jgi:endoglucanase